MTLAVIEHHQGYGGAFLVRVQGFKPNDPDAIEYAAEQWAEKIGTMRGGDGYGYDLDYGEGKGWNSLNVHWLDDGKSIITSSWSPNEPARPLTITKVTHNSPSEYWPSGSISIDAIDGNDRDWRKFINNERPEMAQWETDPDDDEEYWIVRLCGTQDYDNDLIYKARHGANNPPKPGRYDYGRLYPLPEVIE